MVTTFLIRVYAQGGGGQSGVKYECKHSKYCTGPYNIPLHARMNHIIRSI